MIGFEFRPLKESVIQYKIKCFYIDFTLINYCKQIKILFLR